MLDEEEKKLRTSEEVQTISSEAERKERARIERDITQLRLEGAQADAMRQRALDSGCPAERQEVLIEVYNRCTPIQSAHKAIVAELIAR